MKYVDVLHKTAGSPIGRLQHEAVNRIKDILQGRKGPSWQGVKGDISEGLEALKLIAGNAKKINEMSWY